jgi:hypothetical protein
MNTSVYNENIKVNSKITSTKLYYLFNMIIITLLYPKLSIKGIDLIINGRQIFKTFWWQLLTNIIISFSFSLIKKK